MKKILLALAAVATIFAGCNKGLEDRVSNLENRVSEIEALLTELDVRVKGINTIVSDLQKNVYVTDVKPVEENGDVIGYTLTFTEGEPVTIYHGEKGDIGATGKAGSSLTIDWFDPDGEGPEDGDWYWKYQEGNWLTDGDNKIPAVKPLDFEIKEGVLWVKVGNVEEELGSVHGDSWFDDVVVDNEAGTVTIVIPGASQHLVLPFNAAAADGFALNLNLPASTEVILGGTINISYTLAGCDAKDAAVFVQAPEDWIVAVDEAAQKIALTVGEKAGRVVIYAVNNVTGEVRAKFVAYNPETMLIFGIEKSAFYLLSDGSNSIKIPVSTGLKYRVEKSDWLTVAEAPATRDVTMTHKVYTVTAGENTTENTREGEVTFWKSDGSKLLYTVTVLQKGYNPALLFDGEGNPIKWQETFSLKKGSDIKNFKNDDVTIELSDDPAKGTYKIKNMFEADNYYVDGGSLSGEGAEYYADVEGNTMTVYVDKTPRPSYYFTDKIVTLTVDLENMKLIATSDISATLAYVGQTSVVISGYTVEIPAPSEGGNSIFGSYLESFTSGGMSTAAPGKNLTIEVSDDPSKGNVMITSFLGQSGISIYGTMTTKITVAGDPGNYSVFLGNIGPCPAFKLTIKDGVATFDESVISYPTIGAYSATGTSSLLGSYLESFTSTGMSTAAPGKNLTIEASDDPSKGNVMITSFLGQSGISIYGTMITEIEVAGDPGNYSVFLGNIGPCPAFKLTIKDGIATFNESVISYPAIGSYTATKQ